MADAVDIATGHAHACAVSAAGTITCWGAYGNAFCWGDNRYGQRGRGGVTDTPVAPLTW